MTLHLSIRQLVLSAALLASGAALAAPAAPSPAPQQGGADAHGHHGMMGMMGGGMMAGGGMKDMQACQSMMDHRSGMAGMGLPRLPAGNEKLEAQMHAEMLQKLGEISARYADRIKDTQ